MPRKEAPVCPRPARPRRSEASRPAVALTVVGLHSAWRNTGPPGRAPDRPATSLMTRTFPGARRALLALAACAALSACGGGGGASTPVSTAPYAAMPTPTPTPTPAPAPAAPSPAPTHAPAGPDPALDAPAPESDVEAEPLPVAPIPVPAPAVPTVPTTVAPATTAPAAMAPAPAAPVSSELAATAPASPAPPASATSPATVPVAVTDVVGRLDPRLHFAAQQWQAQCDGWVKAIKAIPEPGITGAALEDGTTLKLGQWDSPDGDGATVLAFRANPRNQLASGAQRCEGVLNDASARLPRGQVMWWAFRMWIDDWRTTLAGDSQLVTQFWGGDPTANLNPLFALYVANDTLTGVVRYDTSGTPSKATTVERRLFSRRGGDAFRRWIDVVVQAAVSPEAADQPFLRLWIDGQELGSYAGPIGYRLNALPAAKIGVYKYASSSWDMAIPTRQLFVKNAILVRDPGRAYSQATVRDALRQ